MTILQIIRKVIRKNTACFQNMNYKFNKNVHKFCYEPYNLFVINMILEP